MKRTKLFTLVFVIVAVVSGWAVLRATPFHHVQAAATGINGPAPLVSGFPLVLGTSESAIYQAPVTLADIDGDGQPEIVVGGRNLNADGSLGCYGMVYVIKANGTFLWKKQVRADINAAISVADLNGDGVPDLIVPMGAWDAPGASAATECGQGDPNLPGNGGVVALNGVDGSELWTFNTADWGEWGTGPNGVLDGVFSTPAVGDVDGDGYPEIAFGAWDDCIYLLDRFGHELWGRTPFAYDPKFCNQHGFFNHDTVWSSPVLADMDGDGKLDIVIGGDISCTDPTNPALCNYYMLPNGGLLWVIRYDGVPLGRRWFDQAIHSSPAVGDLNNDGVPDIVVGTGTAFPGTGYYVTAMHLDATRPYSEALVLNWQHPVSGRVESSPALGDLEGNGKLDVAIIALAGDNGPIGSGSNNGSYVYALRGLDGGEIWKTHACDSVQGMSFPIYSSPIMADIAGDSRPEVLFAHGWELQILNPDGTYYSKANTSLGCTGTTGSLTYVGTGSIRSTPALGDLIGDGKVEIVAAGWYNEGSTNRGVIYVWSTNHVAGTKYWPMFHRYPDHTGVLKLPSLNVSPAQLLVLHQQSGPTNPENAMLLITNPGQDSFMWTSTAPTGVTLSPSSGTVVTQSLVQVTISTAGHTSAGTYPLGSIVITGSGVAGSPATIPVTLRVANLSKVFLPAIFRR